MGCLIKLAGAIVGVIGALFVVVVAWAFTL